MSEPSEKGSKIMTSYNPKHIIYTSNMKSAPKVIEIDVRLYHYGIMTSS